MSLKARLYTALLSCVLAGALSINARAGTLQPTGFIFAPADTFAVHRDAVNQNVYVGGFTGAFDLVDIVFWCFDLDNTFAFGNNYDYTEVPLSSPTLERQLARLFDEAYASATTDGADASAAFQLAIWNLEYDNDATVSAPGFPGNPTNHFWATGGPTNHVARDLANTWLQNLDNYTGDGWTVTELLSTPDRYGRHRQNFITATYQPPRQDVPEPSALPLALTALAGLVLMRSYKRERARGG